MQTEGTNIQFAHATVNNYINEIKTYTEQQVNEIKTNYERQINKLKNNAIEYQNKYLEIKERYDLLIYKRFVRSAEQLPVDRSHPLLFTSEADPVEIKEEDKEKTEQIEVKSYTRNRCGRKPIDAKIPREERIIDIPEEEKRCACGADLTRIGEETSEKLHIVEPRIYVEKTIRPKYACRLRLSLLRRNRRRG